MSLRANVRFATYLTLCTALLTGCASSGVVEVQPTRPSTARAESRTWAPRSVAELSSPSVLDSIERRLSNFRPRNAKQAAHLAKTVALLQAIRQHDRSALDRALRILRTGAGTDDANASSSLSIDQPGSHDSGLVDRDIERYSSGLFSSELFDFTAAGEMTLSGPSSVSPVSLSSTCEYVDEDNVTWSGACATQQQLADAEDLLSTATDDSASTHSAARSDSTSYCAAPQNWNDPLCVATDDWDGHEVLLGGPSIEQYSFEAFAVGTHLPNTMSGCLGDWGTLGAALFNSGRKIWKLHRAAIVATGPVGAAVEAAGWEVVGASALAAIAMLTVYECMT